MGQPRSSPGTPMMRQALRETDRVASREELVIQLLRLLVLAETVSLRLSAQFSSIC